MGSGSIFCLTSVDISYLSQMYSLLRQIDSNTKDELELLWVSFWSNRRRDDYEKLLAFCLRTDDLKRTGALALVRSCGHRVEG